MGSLLSQLDKDAPAHYNPLISRHYKSLEIVLAVEQLVEEESLWQKKIAVALNLLNHYFVTEVGDLLGGVVG